VAGDLQHDLDSRRRTMLSSLQGRFIL
jgi:hypothetical protein